MFTSNFFNDNSQLNYGKHLSKIQKLNPHQKKSLSKVIDSVKRIKLRKNAEYNEQHKMFLSIGLIISLALVIFAFEWKTYDKPEVVNLQNIQLQGEEILDIPMTEQPPPLAPKKMAVTVIEVPDIEEVEEEIDIDLDIETNEQMVMEDVAYEEVEVEEEETDEVFLIVEKAPEPAGGLQEFYSYIAKEINYPSAALRAHIGGRVFVQFVVNKDGSLSDFNVVKGIGLGCDEEAVRVLKKAPNWIPGKQRGKEVRVRMILPVNFLFKD